MIQSSPLSGPTTQPAAYSEYELLRIRNIQRNNARLRSLGLLSAKEEQDSNTRAATFEHFRATNNHFQNRNNTLQQVPPSTSTSSSSKHCKPKGEKRIRSKDNHDDNDDHMIGSRKSLRLQGKHPENNGIMAVRAPVTSTKSLNSSSLLDGTATSSSTLLLEEERRTRVRECREMRLRHALELSKVAADRAARENPTATYEHCLMRVRSMSDKRLQTRIKVIERAAGKHCVIKMAIFKSCLQDENKWELADMAASALERLKSLVPPLEDE